MGTAFTEDPVLSSVADFYPYYWRGMDRKFIGVVIYKQDTDDDVEATTLSPEALSDISDEEQKDLITSIGADQFGNTYRKDQYGLIFAANFIIHNYPDLAKHLYKRQEDGPELINIHELLPAITPGQKKESLLAHYGSTENCGTKAAID